MTRALPLLAALALGCSDDPAPARQPDAARDAEVAADMIPVPDAAPDAGRPDAQPVDAAPPRDAGPDQGPPCDPSPERCNGVDDDCDGRADEDFDVDAPCGAGIGACRQVARLVCTDDGGLTCPASAQPPVAELCNGLDDDCDGRTDEDFDGDGDGAPRCPEDPCAADCPPGDEARCRALCDAQDCRDEDLGVFPGAPDACGDGIDQNCDGVDAPCTLAVGRVDALAVAMAAEAACPDVNGDGAPDNAMALLGGIANGALADAVADRSVNLFFLAAGLLPPGLDGAFDLGVVTASVEGEGFVVDAGSLDERGQPRIRFDGARVRAGDLRAGPGRFELSLPVAGLDLRLVLFSALVQGDLRVDDDFGLGLADAVVWGAVREVDLNATLDGLEQACQDAEPEPSFCGPLRQFRPVLANVLRKDEDVDGDGELDAFSVCIQAQVAPAALGGL
ncbi:MAG: putative metal-binding motif-containing protein [Myxococcales bacterium]|nr:putative metal-binding motif-containing protein [Myxococcales bacterium]